MSKEETESIQEELLYTSPNPAMNFLKDRGRWLERDLLKVGTAMFNLEAALKLGKRIEKVVIPLSQETIRRTDLGALQYELEDLVLNVLVEGVKVEFVRDTKSYRWQARRYDPEPSDSVCLFSGGVDSYSGLLNWVEHYKTAVGVSVVHGDQAWGVNIVNRVTNKIRSRYDIRFYMLYAPRMMSRGYSQLRGFLYCLYGGIYVSLLKAQRLLVTEVGPTMYQPRFSPYDTVTMTTHPFVLKKVKRVLSLLLQRDIQMVIPYENMTKSEVVAVSPLPEGFPLTHSCISLRFGRNEGTCFGCTVRRLGFLVAGRDDVRYTGDPIGCRGANTDNLLSLMRFSYDVLADYQHMLASSVENIEDFGKRDLFNRFALDTFAGLYVYRNEVGPLNPHLNSIYEAAIDRLAVSRLEKRIAKVRRPTFRPNFSKTV
jgi:7-cyano-7-deazaguanine synthase in queuosine biosynthesis